MLQLVKLLSYKQSTYLKRPSTTLPLPKVFWFWFKNKEKQAQTLQSEQILSKYPHIISINLNQVVTPQNQVSSN